MHYIYEAMAQLAARRIPDPKVGGSNPSGLNLKEYIIYSVFIRYIIICNGNDITNTLWL